MLAALREVRRIARGAWDCRRRPELRDPWGGPFNDRAARVALVRSLFDTFRPWAIVETGAFRGTTTEFFAHTGLPVFSAEAAEFESYESCATVASLSEFLVARGFRLVRKDTFAEHPSLGGYYDLLFERTSRRQ